MIETREAVEQIDAILDVPGIDAVYIGPADLSITYGLRPGMDQADEEWNAAIASRRGQLRVPRGDRRRAQCRRRSPPSAPARGSG